METNLTQVEKQARRLSVKEREALARTLLDSTSETKLTKLELAWVEEAEKRYQDIKSGKSKVSSLSSVMREARKITGR